MASLEQRIRELIAQPQLAGFATINDGKPWVRYVMIRGSEDMDIRFASFVDARKVQQIAANPEVHLTCGVTDPTAMTPYLQIQGRARFSTDAVERHGFWNDKLKPIFSGPDDPKYGVVIVTPYRIEFCSPGVYEPEVWEK